MGRPAGGPRHAAPAGMPRVASGTVNSKPWARGRASRTTTIVAGIIVVVAAVVGLGAQAVSGAHTVNAQRQPTTVRNATIDDEYYQCLDIQARSLISPNQSVAIYTPNLADFISLLKAIGSWVTFADRSTSADVRLSLRTIQWSRWMSRFGGRRQLCRSPPGRHRAGRDGGIDARPRSAAGSAAMTSPTEGTMTTVPATIVAMVVLGAAGLLPTLALVGRRWITFPLVPLAGAVIAALAATVFVAVGGAFMVVVRRVGGSGRGGDRLWSG